MTDPLADLARCPGCVTGLLVPADGARTCPACGRSYPVKRGVLELMPGLQLPRSIADLAMRNELVVALYESALWRRGPGALALGISFSGEQELVFRAAALRGDEAVLDIACGTGIYTRPFAARVPRGRVVGLDLSRPMLASAVRRAARERLDNVGFVHASALDLPFPESRFAVVNCGAALHLFPDTRRALAEIHRVLEPGGRFTVTAFRGLVGPVSQLFAPLTYLLIGARSFAARELEGLLTDAGFVDTRFHHAWGLWFVVSARAP